MEGFSQTQRGTVGDITAGLSLGPWTKALAQTLMKRDELFTAERDIQGSARENLLAGLSEEYRARIAAGDLYYPYVDYPYLEWFSENGRVVLELDRSQIEIVKVVVPLKEKTPEELLADETKRDNALGSYLGRMVEDLSRENRKKGGDGNVTGIVVS